MNCAVPGPINARLPRRQTDHGNDMPIYEYECGACGDSHEFIQKFSEGPKRKCPSCGKLRLKKMVSAAAFHLKGTGWYVTDFRDGGKGKNKDGAGKDGGDKSSSKESSASSSDSSSSDSKSKSSSEKSKSKSKKPGSKSASANA